MSIRPIFFGLALPVLGAATLRAQTTAAPSDQNYPPRIAGAVVHTYKTVGTRALNLWILEPRGDAGGSARPAMVFFFGGGWTRGTPAQFEAQASALAAFGMVSVLADYRVFSRDGTSPADAVSDAKSAMRWVRAHAREFGIDPNRIGAAGGSAGGHLAAATATVPGFDASTDDQSVSPVPDALVLFNPAVVTDSEAGLPTPVAQIRTRMGIDAWSLSPYPHLKAGLPPTLIQHGRNDHTVPFSTVQAYCTRAKALGDRCDLIGYDGADHGFFNHQEFQQRTFDRMVAFLKSLGWIAP